MPPSLPAITLYRPYPPLAKPVMTLYRTTTSPCQSVMKHDRPSMKPDRPGMKPDRPGM